MSRRSFQPFSRQSGRARRRPGRRWAAAPWSLGFERLEDRYLLAANLAGGVLTVDGTNGDDSITIRLKADDPATVQAILNAGTPDEFVFADVDSIVVNGSDGSDRLTIDNSNGIVNRPVEYDGGTSAGDNDSLFLTGTAQQNVQKETYAVGATEDAGAWTLDPDTDVSDDELKVTFKNIEPVDSDVHAADFDLIMAAGKVDWAFLEDGDLLGPAMAQSLRIRDVLGTFETVQLANKTLVRVMGNDMGDVFEFSYTTVAAGLKSVEVYGHLAAGIAGPADDDAQDHFFVEQNGDLLPDKPRVTLSLFGQGGDDGFFVGYTASDLSLIVSPVTIVGGAGADVLSLDNDPDTIGAVYTLNDTGVSLDGRRIVNPFDDTLEFLKLYAGTGADLFNVRASEHIRFGIVGDDPGPPGPGDSLRVSLLGAAGARLVPGPEFGSGTWEFDTLQDIEFVEIEDVAAAQVFAYGPDFSRTSAPVVKIVDAASGIELRTITDVYESNYRGGVRVALGDLNGDGIPELVTAPGAGRAPTIKVFDITTGAELTDFRFDAFDTKKFKKGLNVAVGDVNGDGQNDIVVVPSFGQTEVRVFLNDYQANPNAPFTTIPFSRFLAFGPKFIGGASVAVADLEASPGAEIIVGNGIAMRSEVRIFKGDSTGDLKTPAPFITSFKPFDDKFRGGVSLSVVGDAIFVGAGQTGASRIELWAPFAFGVAAPVSTGVAFPGSHAPVRLASNVDFALLATEGPHRKSDVIAALVSSLPLTLNAALSEPDPVFAGGLHLGLSNDAIPVPLVPAHPLLNFNAAGTVTYTAASDQFLAMATPLMFQETPGAPLRAITGAPLSFKIDILVDDAGTASGSAGDDLLVEGSIDIDGDGTDDVTGTLLTGEILEFTARDGSGPDLDRYEFRFEVTGGALASYFTDKDIGVTLTSNPSTFAGVFTADFMGGAAGMVGSLPQLAPIMMAVQASVQSAVQSTAKLAAPLSSAGLTASLSTIVATTQASTAAPATAASKPANLSPPPSPPVVAPPPAVKPAPAVVSSAVITRSILVSATSTVSKSPSLAPLTGKSLLTTILA